MLRITELLCGPVRGSQLPPKRKDESSLPPSVERPVVIWNLTRRCNLHCLHCYSQSQDRAYADELTTDEGKRLIADLADYKIPMLILSGGDPLFREDLYTLAGYAKDLGLRCALSTNGTLIDAATAKRLRRAGITYVGVSLDGIGPVHDRFRGMDGSFALALQGLRYARDEGIKVGVRTALCRRTLPDLPAMCDLAEQENLDRLYFAHLVYSGRGAGLIHDDLLPEEKRAALDYLIQKGVDFHRRGFKIEVTTGNNDADGVYLYLKMRSSVPAQSESVFRLLKRRGGNSSGISLSCIDSLGHVHADPFWRHYSFGNIRERSFAGIWEDTADPIMRVLKDRSHVLKGRCARCPYLELCGGNSRVRAEATTGDLWDSDPCCYLSDEELGISSDGKEDSCASTYSSVRS
ncbi:MAG: radical SAM protein [candidate division NC10 bacterium]|nr:radical SAM protein [candidate division NC10 bacterium]MDE2322297.1 radical SAM protein [candidate division NC10 bacterium]